MDGSAPNFNQPNSLYSYPNPNPNYMPPQTNIEQNSEGYNSQGNNNIYSGYSPQMGGNIYSQVSGNIYSQPQNNLPYGTQPSGNIYNAQFQDNTPLYVPQAIPNVSPEYPPQTSGEIAVSSLNVSPPTVPTDSPITTEPLIPTSDVVVVKRSCCETDESIEPLTGLEKCGVIFSNIALAIIGFNDMAFTLSTENINHALFLAPDLLYLFFSIFESITIMRVRWLRTTGGVLSIVFLVLSIAIGILQLIHLNDHKGEIENIRSDDGKDRINDCMVFPYLRVAAFTIILNIIFYAYWKLKICCRCENTGSSSHYNYEYDSGTYITTSSHHHTHHHSPPHHHSSPHHSAPHHSAPHHSAPKRSSPHHSAPHHAPHRSAPHHAAHHSAHHSAHHGGHGRH